MDVWRLPLRSHADPDGEGARRYGGRWDAVGTAVIDTVGSLALAVLELLIHVDVDLLPRHLVSVSAHVPDDLVRVTYAIDELPPDWNRPDGAMMLQRIGTTWATSRQSVVLEVPSVIVSQERNYVLTPHHPDFSRITWSTPSPFAIDPRLFANPL